MRLIERLKAALSAFNGYHMQEWSANRRAWVQQSQSARKDIPYAVRRKMLSWSREMERKDPIFNRFLDLCEQYVVGPTGLRIVSGSKDQSWAIRANDVWDQWQPWCDISSRFSFGQRQSLIERECEVAGECFVYLTYGSSNFPRIQIIEAENVETPPKLANDASVIDGVKVDSNLRPLGYYVRPAGDDQKSEWPLLDAAQVVHIFEPSRVGQVRGLPIIYPVLRELIDLAELQELEMLAAKDAATVSKVIKTASGELSATDMRRARFSIATQTPAGAATTTSKTDFYKEAVGAETIVLQNGDDMQQFRSDRPSVAVQSFWDYVSARAASGMGLPIEIIIMRSLQGTMTRAALDMANTFFRCRAASRAEAFGRIWEHVVGSDFSLRKAQPIDWRRTRYTPPRAINVDVGRNSRALIDEWKAGFRTLESISAETGQDWREILTQRAEEASFAKELEISKELPPGSILGGEPPAPPQPDPNTTEAVTP